MNFLKKLLKASPTPTVDGAFQPSPLALKLATSSKTDYDGGAYTHTYAGENRRVLMVCSEERHMTMANGRKFSTGNHPTEMGLPMLHLLSAGFEIDIFTPTGAPVIIEDWAMPLGDEAVMKLYRDYAGAFTKPGSLDDFVSNEMAQNTTYCAVFLPGGHGAMLGLPENVSLGKLLRWAHERHLLTLAICHGPAALLAAKEDGSFIYDGYKIAAFPDSVDKQTPMIGYMPGHMPWMFGEKLKELGIEIVNSKADATCCVDRRLVTGASPKAANTFGRCAAETLLKELR